MGLQPQGRVETQTVVCSQKITRNLNSKRSTMRAVVVW